MIQAYIGNGKGKSTAAIGLLIRAFGAGLRVYALYFDKGGKSYVHGELKVFERLGIPYDVTGIERMTSDGKFRFGVTEEDKIEARRGLKLAFDALDSEKFDLMIFDEILTGVSGGLLKAGEVVKLIETAPKKIEIVMTGRCEEKELLERADLVSNVQKISHYFDRGVQARFGIEY